MGVNVYWPREPREMDSEALYFPPGGRVTDRQRRDSLSEKLRDAGKEEG